MQVRYPFIDLYDDVKNSIKRRSGSTYLGVLLLFILVLFTSVIALQESTFAQNSSGTIKTENKAVVATPQNTKSAYKAAILDGCAQFNADIDKQSACLTGGMGEGTVQYYPSTNDTCEFLPGYKADNLTAACKVGVAAGRKAFTSIYGGVSNAYAQSVQQSCQKYKSNDTQFRWCLYGGMGVDGKEGFPTSPASCLAKPALSNQDANQSACLHGVAAGNSVLLNYAETGKIVNADGTKVAQPGGGSAGGSGQSPNQSEGGSGSTPSTPGTAPGSSGTPTTTPGGASNPGSSGSNSGSPTDQPKADDFKENKGADKNGPGTVTLEKVSGATPNLPFANRSNSSYTDGGGGTQMVDFFHPDDRRRPLIIFVPGGGWRNDGGTFQRDFQERAGEQGFASIRANYRKMPNGLYATYNDIENLLTSVRQNADKYNIDPNRIVMWGDSAGGSLTARTAASGRSGLATAVTWSGPTNALRGLFQVSPESFLIGIDHSTCINTEWTKNLTDLQEVWRGKEFLLQDPMRILSMSPEEQMQILDNVMKSGPLIENSIRGAEQMFEGWDVDVDRATELITSTRDSFYQLGVAVQEMDPNVPISRKPDLMANSSLGSAADTIHTVLPRLAKHANLSAEVQEQVAILSTLDKALGNGIDSPEKIEQAIRTIASDKTIQRHMGLDGSRNVNPDEVNALITRVAEGSITQDEAIQAATPIVKAVLGRTVDTLGTLTQEKSSSGQTNILTSISQSSQKGGKNANSKLTKAQAEALAVTALTDAEVAELAKTQGFSMDVARLLTDDEQTLSRLGNLTKTIDSASLVLARNTSLLLDDLEGTSNNQIIPLRKIAECVDNIIQASPALFAHPNTPPMFLANAMHERVVPAADAHEMADRLRSFGTRAEVLILPGDLHMGYDQRAEAPSFRFIREETRPEPVRQPEQPKTTIVPGPKSNGAAGAYVPAA